MPRLFGYAHVGGASAVRQVNEEDPCGLGTDDGAPGFSASANAITASVSPQRAVALSEKTRVEAGRGRTVKANHPHRRPAPSPRCAALLALVASASCAGVAAQPQLPPLFSDGVVLQRGQPLRVWGWATPGARITVEFDGRHGSATTDTQGGWRVQLPAHAAGGPYLLKVSGDGGERVLHDVLVGDVWLASGQSNMEWSLQKLRDGAATIANANDRQLRHFKLPNAWAVSPQGRWHGGEWKAASPDEAGSFSAVGYFFARELRRSTGVPIAIIDSSWGGSTIEAWMDAASQGLDPTTLPTRLQQAQQRQQQELHATRQRVARWPQHEEGAGAWSQVDFDDSDWQPMTVPGNWEAAGFAGMDGVAWYRRQFTLSAAEAEAGITLSLGQIDDSDVSYVNGQQIGSTEMQWNATRLYRVPAAALHGGVNQLAIRVTDLGAGGGIRGRSEDLYLQVPGEARRSIAGNWRFRAAKAVFPTEADRNQQPTLLYNQMIRPLQAFPLKGVIWYQGESNAYPASALRYRQQFTSLIEQWRGERGQPRLPFLWVQLASYVAGADQGDLSPWALLRESQSMALALPATAQVVSIDIGEPHNIHPGNKQEVGYRLALAARHVAYGEQLVYSAPTFSHARFGNGQVQVHFKPTGSALAVRGGGDQVHGFSVAGTDRVFHPAQAWLREGIVVVSSTAVPQPLAVRYGWSECPLAADLINRERLPVSPFRSDDW